METRDRRANLGFFAAAVLAWVAVGAIVLTIDPILVPAAGYAGAGAIGLAVGLTTAPLFWLAAFARQRRIAYRRSWTRAIRRGAWAGLVVFLMIVLRLQDLFQPQIALFIIALALVAETAMSTER